MATPKILIIYTGGTIGMGKDPVTSSASSGNNALKLSFTADYTLSKMLTMSFYYDRQTNTPLLSSSSYPTTTQDFGLSIKFSLTR